MNKVKTNFQALIRRVLKEELEKRDTIEERVPEQDGNGLNSHRDNNSRFANQADNPRDKKTKDQLLTDLTKVVKGVNDEYIVVWDDHDDIKVDARDLMSMRINPKWEDHYDVVVMTRNEDRVWVSSLTWEQLKDFVKSNLEQATEKPTAVEKAYDKVYRNKKDQSGKTTDKGLPQDNKQKIKSVGLDAKKSKDYKETDVKNEDDLPNKQMKEVGDFDKQIDKKAQRPPKRGLGKPVTKFKETQR